MSRRARNRKEVAEAIREQATAAESDTHIALSRRAWLAPLGASLYFAALLVFGWFSQFYSPFVREGDELYHFHHALLYRLHGPWSSAFPWVTYSVISRYNSDLWYGYHILLMPFTIGNPVYGLKWGAVLLTAASAAVFWFAVRMRGAPITFLWPTLFLFATGFGLSRFYTLRPEVVSMALIALLLSALFGDRRKLACVIGAVFAFIHLTVVWLPLMVCAAVAVMSRLFDGRWRWQVIGWTCLGLAIGTLLRPNPIGGLHLLYVQTILLAQAKMSGAVPSDAQEMLPLGALSLHVVGPFALLLIAATAGPAYANRSGKAPAAASLGSATGYLATTGGLALVFGLGAVFAALRCLDQFHAFGTLYLAGVATALVGSTGQSQAAGNASSTSRGVTRLHIVRAGIAACVGVAFICLGALNAFRGDPSEDLNTYKYHDAAAWLRHNTPAESIVFHARWSDFPSLWFWDDHNRFIAGMDPIFSYADDPKKFPEYAEFRKDEVGYPIPEPAAQVDFAPYARDVDYQDRVLTHDFGATYVVIEPATQPILANYLTGNKEAAKCFDKDGIRIYSLVRSQ